LWLFQYSYPDHQGATTPADVTLHLDAEARLLLPVLDLDARTVFPVPAVRFPNSTYIPEMYVRVPVLDNVDPARSAQPAGPMAVPVNPPAPLPGTTASGSSAPASTRQPAATPGPAATLAQCPNAPAPCDAG
jgi:hypothetical protein